MERESELEIPDNELIRAAAGGDLDAFGTLYDRYLQPIYRYVYYRVSEVHDSEDLTEEVFVRAWKALQKTGKNPAIKNVRAWLYRIAHNLVVDHHRKTQVETIGDVLEEGAISASEGSVEDVSVRRQEAKRLEDAIRSLEEPMRQVIILRFINGMSHHETSQVVGLNEGHVRVLQYRALQKLRKLLEKDY